jgi:DNA-binding transcriptional ArsR family regulator
LVWFFGQKAVSQYQFEGLSRMRSDNRAAQLRKSPSASQHFRRDDGFVGFREYPAGDWKNQIILNSVFRSSLPEVTQSRLEIETHFVHRCLGRLPKYTFTRICYVEYTQGMESVFEIIAEPNRRAILSLLVSSQQSVGEIERQLRMTQPTVSKHLRVLREAGFVESTVDAQRRLYRLKPEPFQEVDAWLARFRRFWSAHVDALERHLDRMDPSIPSKSTPTKRKTSKRGRGPNRERDKGETK